MYRTNKTYSKKGLIEAYKERKILGTKYVAVPLIIPVRQRGLRHMV